MKGISDLIETDMEDSANFIDENSILSSASEVGSIVASKPKGGRPKGSKNRVTKPKTTARRAKASPETATKKQPSRATAAKRKALEEHINGQGTRSKKQGASKKEKLLDEFVDELESPKTLGEERQQITEKPKAWKQKRGAKQDASETEEVEQTPTVTRSSSLQGAARRDTTKVITKRAATGRPKNSQPPRQTISHTQPEPVEMDVEVQDHSELAPLPVSKPKSRSDSRALPEAAPRRRAGSASDTERGGDPNLRRKLGDVTRKLENVDLKYRNLKEVGISEANANVEKLRKQCEATTAASNELVASLKKELAMHAPLAAESRKLQKTLALKDSETNQLRASIDQLATSLSAAQNEIKSLQAKLAASRSASVPVEAGHSRAPGSSVKNSNQQVRTIMVGSAEVAQAAQIAQLKEDLYSDLTGLIVRSVKRSEGGDTYDCIQTGRNGSKSRSTQLPIIVLTPHSPTFQTFCRTRRKCQIHKF